MDKKEAIKILRELHDKALFSERTALETLHPELKESEDERIRKELIEHVKDQQSSFISAPDCRDKYEEEENNKYNSWLSWLEKQGTSYTKRDVDNAYVEGMAFAKNELEKQGNSFIKWNKNTKDNKPQFNHSVLFQTKFDVIAEGEWNGKEWLQYRWGCGIDDSAVTCWMELSALKKQGEQKPADEEMKEILRTEYEKGRADVIAQMQKEWSKEDENHVISLLERLEGLCRNEFERTRFAINEDQDWLKSLKERYSWKPSDAQIRALEYIIDNAHNTSYSCKIAKELLEQLKKLKRE